MYSKGWGNSKPRQLGSVSTQGLGSHLLAAPGKNLYRRFRLGSNGSKNGRRALFVVARKGAVVFEQAWPGTAAYNVAEAWWPEAV